MTAKRDRNGNNTYRTYMVYRDIFGANPILPVPCPYLDHLDIHVEDSEGIPLDFQWISEGFIRIQGSLVDGLAVVRRKTSLVNVDTFSPGDILSERRLNGPLLRSLYRTQEGVDLARRFAGLYPAAVLGVNEATVDPTATVVSLVNQRVFVNGAEVDGSVASLNPGDNFVTLLDDDGYPVLIYTITRVVWSINDPTVDETDSTATFTVTRSDPGRPVVVGWSTVNGTAVAGVDYTAVSVTGFTLGSGTLDIPVTIIDRPGTQGDRAFTLSVSLEGVA